MIAGITAYVPYEHSQQSFGITAEAVQSLKKPVISQSNVYSNKIEIKVNNISSYSDNTNFEIYNGNKKIRTVTAKALKNQSSHSLSLIDDGTNYLKPSTVYSFRIRAVKGNKKTSFTGIKIKTLSKTYYKINANVPLYKISGGKLKRVSKTTKAQYVPAVQCNSAGSRISGKSIRTNNCKTLYINSGSYKGYYISLSSKNCCRITERTAKINTVVSYAVGMNGGRYVWGGASYRATDCSGLTMLAYRQIGVNISHSTYTQARMGKPNSLKNIKAGDVIICNNYGHAALYIGNGKIIHAMNSYYGIRIQPLANIRYCGAINTIRTII